MVDIKKVQDNLKQDLDSYAFNALMFMKDNGFEDTTLCLFRAANLIFLAKCESEFIAKSKKLKNKSPKKVAENKSNIKNYKFMVNRTKKLLVEAALTNFSKALENSAEKEFNNILTWLHINNINISVDEAKSIFKNKFCNSLENSIIKLNSKNGK